jgi:hypothetical protein
MIKKGVSSEDEWIKHYVDAYLTVEKRFLRKGIGGVHIEYSQPARGPEIGSIKVSNSIYLARNIYVINSRLCILTMYDKARKRRFEARNPGPGQAQVTSSICKIP